MPAKRLRWSVSKNKGLIISRAVVVSDSSFIGFHASRELLTQGLAVYYIKDLAQKDSQLISLKREFSHFQIIKPQDLPADFDYLFQIKAVSLEGDFSLIKGLSLAEDKGAKFLFSTVFKDKFPLASLADLTRKKNVNWRLVHFNFLYGSSWEENFLLEQMFSQIKQGRILVSGTGEEKVYPLFIDDFVQGLMRAMFSQDSKGRVYRLTGLQETKLLDFAWQIKRVAGKDWEVVFVKKKEVKTWTIGSLLLERIKKNWGQLVYRPKFNLDEGIRKTLEGTFSSTRKKTKKGKDFIKKFFSKISFIRSLKKDKKTKTTSQKRNLVGKILFCLFPLFFLLISCSPLFVFATFSLNGYKKIAEVEKAIKSGQLEGLAKEAASAKRNFLLSRQILWKFAAPFSFVGLKQKVNQTERLMNLSINLSEALENVIQAGEEGQALKKIVFEREIDDPKARLEKMLVILAEIDKKLAFSQIQIGGLEELDLPFFTKLKSRIEQFENQLPSFRQKIKFARKFLSLSSRFLAFDDRRTYLLLLQNNMELRPTGGFIGSYGLLTFEKGRFLDLVVEDIYSADGQLKGHVEPPKPLKEYLGQGSWYLRDSNFSPDFPTSAKQAEWFLEKETGQKVDGVIAINLNFVKNLLEVVGPVRLPEYDEEITADNLFERAEYHAEIDFFPGSTQKKSFLASLATFLFEKMKDFKPSTNLELSMKLEENLKAKDVIFSFHDQVLQSKIRFLGWNGEVKQVNFGKTSQFKGPGLIDYFMVVDANVGVNKTNYFLTRRLDLETTILKEGEIVNRATLIYHNASPSQTWPGGTYKNYLRILLPRDVEKVTIKQGNLKEKNLKTVDSSKIDKAEEFDKKIFGFLLEVPPLEEKKVTITYQREEKLLLNKELIDYVFYVQKQPGTKNDPLDLKVNFPVFLKPIKIMPEASWKSQQVVFKQELDEDKLFAVEFSR